MRVLAILFCATALYAQKDFVTGMGARLVMGQPTFTAQEVGASATLLGGVGGLAYANDMLFVVDSNRLSAGPINHRVLIYKNLGSQLPAPEDELPQGERCPVCVGQADVVMGQTAFEFPQDEETPGIEGAEIRPPSRDTLRLPLGVATDGVRVVVADADNNRVLIWNSIPNSHGVPADVVVGQPDFESGGPLGFTPTAQSLKGPQGVWLQDGRLFIADSGNNRVLIYNSIPTGNHASADVVLGQKDFNSFVQPDLTKAQLEPKADTLLTPVSVTSDGQRLYVADLGHNRVLIWNSIPGSNAQPADVVIGQHNFVTAIANNSPELCASDGEDDDGEPTFPRRCAATMEFPRFALSDGQRLFVADGGNDRVLVYSQIPTANAMPADHVIGQITDTLNLVSDSAFPGDVASAGIIRTPMSLAWDGLNLYVSDPFNRRVLVFTIAERRVANTGLRNAASFEVFALGTVTLSGQASDDDAAEEEVTVNIKSNNRDNDDEGRDYTYKLEAEDDLFDVLFGLTDLINAGSGDPDVLATPNPSFLTLILTSKIAGEEGNIIGYSASVSSGSTIAASTNGTSLRGGEEASKIAPGTVITVVGEDLSDVTMEAQVDSEGRLPTELGGVQLYIDGIRAPLYYVSPVQINAQMPVEAFDTEGTNAYVRTVHSDGRVVASNTIPVPVFLFNPGIFAEGGTDPRPALAIHGSSRATGVVSVDGTATADDVATIIIGREGNERRYTYTVLASDESAEDDPDTTDVNEAEPASVGLTRIQNALMALINENDPE
ncbi:MAG: hypothetical protein GY953_27290, partial [bacterium]|nr:hypothetical protein [bacterium]